jgi:hypothetical protein
MPAKSRKDRHLKGSRGFKFPPLRTRVFTFQDSELTKAKMIAVSSEETLRLIRSSAGGLYL